MNADTGTNVDTGAKAGACAGADAGVPGASAQSDPIRSTEASKGGDREPKNVTQADVTPSPTTANGNAKTSPDTTADPTAANMDLNSCPDTTADPHPDAAANITEDPSPDATTNMDTTDESMAKRTETSEKESKDE